MKPRWVVAALSLVLAGFPFAADAQDSALASRVDALVGLARTAREQGQHETSVACFREADRLVPLAGARLTEFFWAAHRVGASDTALVGTRVLTATPRQSDVRDALIGLAAGRDEARVSELAQQGALLEPARALWLRRLAESALRASRPLEASQRFLEASRLPDAEPADRAQWALALELSGRRAQAVAAWASVAEAVWTSRPDWVASRARAAAAPPMPPSTTTTVPASRPLTPQEIVARSGSQLARTPCAEEPLRALEGLEDARPFLAAVAARKPACVDHAAWTTRAVERAIAAGAFEQALALAAPLAAPGGPVFIREQYGVLLHWLGRDDEAEPVLTDVVQADSGAQRALASLVEARRALGDAEGARALAVSRWQAGADPHTRVILAELALETGRYEEALDLARAVEQDAAIGVRARAVEGGALLSLGRAAEARPILESLRPASAPTLAWLDAVAATEGVAAALASAAALPATGDASWIEVQARRAVWQMQLGHRAEAARLHAEVEAADTFRGRVTAAELALAAGRPAEAEQTLRRVLADRPADQRALDGLSTALAEQGRWDEALAALAALGARRPHDARLAVREAEWRHRQAPGPVTLAALESVVRQAPHADGRAALARGLLRSGSYTRAAETLGAPAGLADHELVLLARSLRAAGRPADALAALRTRRVSVVEALLLGAELEAATRGPAAADDTFRELTGRPDADPAWYLAWADLQSSGTELVRVLDEGSVRFPGEAVLQERLALAAWAARNRPLAERAADLAIAADGSRTGAWFVKAQLTSQSRATSSLARVLSGFESRFAPDGPERIGMAEMMAGLARSPYDAAALRALSWMDGVLAKEPAHTTATIARARLLAALGRTPEALRAIEALMAARPDLPAPLKLQAELLATTTRYADAVRAYDRYLAVVPGDVPARRQQARIDGWRGAFGQSVERYETLCREFPDAPALHAEAGAKRAYYRGRWDEALVHYDAWLLLEPDEVEAALERAQVYDHLGQPRRAAEAFRAVAARVAPNDVALSAAARLDRRRQASVDLFANGQSADAVTRQQLLDLVDTGAAYADDFGLGYGTRARVYGGPSFADGRGRSWRGHHVGAQVAALLTGAVGVSGTATYRQLGALDGTWFGDLGVTWRLRPSLRVSAGAERSLLLENSTTLEEGISAIGPTLSARWAPSADFSLQVAGAWVEQSDRNQRQTLRFSVSERVRGGTNELHLLGSTERLGYREARASYFTPASFWRHDVGAEWRGWLATPRFYGDRERWVSASYMLGVDDRREIYHTGRMGMSYELTNGVGIVADGQVVRSRIFNGARFSVGLRVSQVSLPRP